MIFRLVVLNSQSFILILISGQDIPISTFLKFSELGIFGTFYGFCAAKMENKFFVENEKSTNSVHYFKCILINIHDEVCRYMH